jgi:hypothetical protein
MNNPQIIQPPDPKYRVAAFFLVLGAARACRFLLDYGSTSFARKNRAYAHHQEVQFATILHNGPIHSESRNPEICLERVRFKRRFPERREGKCGVA